LWRQTLDEAPRFVPGLAELANLPLNLGRLQEAEELLARLEALPPQGPTLAGVGLRVVPVGEQNFGDRHVAGGRAVRAGRGLTPPTRR
jgi:hypothetical protein